MPAQATSTAIDTMSFAKGALYTTNRCTNECPWSFCGGQLFTSTRKVGSHGTIELYTSKGMPTAPVHGKICASVSFISSMALSV